MDIEQSQKFICERLEKLRTKLLDLTLRNPLLSTSFSANSTSIIRVVDELPNVLGDKLFDQQQSMRIVPLPSLEQDPKDEKNEAFPADGH